MVNPCTLARAVPLALAAAAITCAVTSAAAEIVLLDMEERLTPEAEVSAEAVFVGLVRPWQTRTERGEPPRPEDAGAAFVVLDVPAAPADADLCLRVVTADGRYSAEDRIPASGLGGASLVQGRYWPEYATVFDYPEEDIAILARACGNAEDAAGAALTLTFGTWQGPFDSEVKPDAAHLLVNSFRATSAIVVVDDTHQTRCEPVSGSARAAFDFRCPLDWAMVGNGAEITLYRVRGGAMDPPVTARIAAPR